MSRLLLSLCLAAASTHAGTHWAFQPLTDPAPPPIKDAPTDTDRFFFAKAAADGLQLPPPASARALLRRASYDLTGLPPSPAETDAFLANPSPDAFAKVIDRLLASPAYGEKWGRLWLDVVRYADTAGETADYPMPHAWRYRNWVINAFNQDLPADEFIRWQIAGDLLAPSGPPDQAADKIIATGFLGIARRFGFNIDQDIHLTYEDAIDTTGKAFLGLSLGCARCHDHKPDPISQRDYYGLYGILQSTRLPFTGCEKTQRPRDMVPILSPAREQEHLKWQAESKAASDALKAADTALEALTPAFAASTVTAIASGTLTPGTATSWPPDPATGTVPVSRGEMLQLSILPRTNFGADGTGIQWSLRETSGQLRQWSLASAFANPAQPDPAWFILDTAREPRLCLHFDPIFENTKGLAAWRGPDLWPSLLVNTLDTPNAYQTLAFPPQSIAVHPGPHGGIAIAFQSQSDGPLSLTLTISEFDPGGDGIDWTLVRRPSIATTLESQRPLIKARLLAAATATDTAAREPTPDLALAVAESTPVNARLHKKGEPKDPGDAVPRKLPDLFGGDLIPDTAGSGRLQLADWLTRGPARHLTARVLANRLWLGHFSEGLVSTPNDFGTKGSPPSNPALLDWLASRLIADHWSLKSMHRRLMLSAAYQRASIGPDVCHLNLHKTFCIPHGGGGPGVGPVCTAAHLAPFIPGRGTTGPVVSAPHGSASINVIPWMYIRMMGPDGLTDATRTAILSANYIAAKIGHAFPILYKGRNSTVAHECIIDVRPFKDSANVSVEDVAKRLIDYGYHAPTMSWPVAGTLRIEPTESESRPELDRFCSALLGIHSEIIAVASGSAHRDNNVLRHAPHTAACLLAADWDRPYSREQAAYPDRHSRHHKYWPPVGRVDNVHGDRNLVCTCDSVTAYAQ